MIFTIIRAGVNPDISRQISRHRKPAIFSRYNMIEERPPRPFDCQTLKKRKPSKGTSRLAIIDNETFCQ